MSLNRDMLLNTMKLKTEEVELGAGTVIVSEIGAADYIKLWSDPKNQKDGTIDMSRFTPALIVYAVVDETGNRIFTDADVDILARSSQGPFLKIAEVARKLNGLSGEETKNSESDQSKLPFSDSASLSESDTPTN